MKYNTDDAPADRQTCKQTLVAGWIKSWQLDASEIEKVKQNRIAKRFVCEQKRTLNLLKGKNGKRQTIVYFTCLFLVFSNFMFFL